MIQFDQFFQMGWFNHQVPRPSLESKPLVLIEGQLSFPGRMWHELDLGAKVRFIKCNLLSYVYSNLRIVNELWCVLGMIVYVYFPHPKNFQENDNVNSTYYFQCVCQNGWEASRRMCCDLELFIKLICFETKNLYTHVNERLVPHETAKWNAMNWMTSIRFESFEDGTVDIEDFTGSYMLSFCVHSKKHTWYNMDIWVSVHLFAAPFWMLPQPFPKNSNLGQGAGWERYVDDVWSLMGGGPLGNMLSQQLRMIPRVLEVFTANKKHI